MNNTQRTIAAIDFRIVTAESKIVEGIKRLTLNVEAAINGQEAQIIGSRCCLEQIRDAIADYEANHYAKSMMEEASTK